MNCREALAKLYEYLDKELTNDENQEVKTHLDVCGYCLQKYKLAEDFDDLVRNASSRTPAAVDQLKNKVLTEIEKIDRGVQPSKPNRNILFLLAPLAAAAIITMFIIDPFGSDGSVLQAVYPYAMEHNKCLDHVMQYVVESQDPQEVHAALASFGEVPSELLLAPEQEFHLAGAAIAHIENGSRPHIDYDYSGNHVSLFVLDKNTLDKSSFEKVEHNGKTFYYGECPKFQYVIFECDQHECIAVSKLGENKLLSFASRL